mmetsp:Transcript_168113/g.539918  ORF Transcript_168113/g.539918 Transcript_168113/m.539918 type:complete len:584 (-) Transcript_168113:93-1844(-)
MPQWPAEVHLLQQLRLPLPDLARSATFDTSAAAAAAPAALRARRAPSAGSSGGAFGGSAGAGGGGGGGTGGAFGAHHRLRGAWIQRVEHQRPRSRCHIHFGMGLPGLRHGPARSRRVRRAGEGALRHEPLMQQGVAQPHASASAEVDWSRGCPASPQAETDPNVAHARGRRGRRRRQLHRAALQVPVPAQASGRVQGRQPEDVRRAFRRRHGHQLAIVGNRNVTDDSRGVAPGQRVQVLEHHAPQRQASFICVVRHQGVLCTQQRPVHQNPVAQRGCSHQLKAGGIPSHGLDGLGVVLEAGDNALVRRVAYRHDATAGRRGRRGLVLRALGRGHQHVVQGPLRVLADHPQAVHDGGLQLLGAPEAGGEAGAGRAWRRGGLLRRQVVGEPALAQGEAGAGGGADIDAEEGLEAQGIVQLHTPREADGEEAPARLQRPRGLRQPKQVDVVVLLERKQANQSRRCLMHVSHQGGRGDAQGPVVAAGAACAGVHGGRRHGHGQHPGLGNGLVLLGADLVHGTRVLQVPDLKAIRIPDDQHESHHIVGRPEDALHRQPSDMPHFVGDLGAEASRILHSSREVTPDGGR